MNTEFREKAKDFASALKNYPPIAAYFRAQKKMETDKETQGLISQFQKKQRELWLNQRNRDLTSAEIMSFRELQAKISGSPIVREFSLAQAKAFDLCRSVAGSLSELLGVDFGTLISPPSSC
jgi:cell fate (sporulation/competence/biofilm development) regulator YlbF (YheA/YmcA/DUF963 family)